MYLILVCTKLHYFDVILANVLYLSASQVRLYAIKQCPIPELFKFEDIWDVPSSCTIALQFNITATREFAANFAITVDSNFSFHSISADSKSKS
jgi:hypothetical protein